MSRSSVERALRDVHARLVKARQQLAVFDEQLMSLTDVADDLRIRSLVSETPAAGKEYVDAHRHAETVARARRAVVEQIAELERRQGELLERLE